ncbi:MAG: iron-sulfur cluster-binding domain-containing protein [Puia sp.]|nr:iron-sulfur cluster-binding domain-containing protein [Puia sp.]
MEPLIFRITDIAPETRDAATLKLEPVGGELYVPGKMPAYEAGQFLTFLLTLRGRALRRSYSICSAPGVDPFLAVTIKRVANGEVSRYLLDHCRVGDTLVSLPPFGRFTLATHPQQQRNIFFIAAGSGMIPVFSLLKKVLREEPLSRVTLLSQDRDEDSILFRKSLAVLRVRFPLSFHWSAFLSKPADPRINGRHLNSTILEETVGRQGASVPDAETLFFLCGPLPFMRMSWFTLRVMGIEERQIKKENFTVDAVPAPPVSTDNRPRRVTIHYRQKTCTIRVAYPDTILTAALHQGIPLPYSCRGGRCSACMARCLDGQVKMSINEVLSEKDLEQGWVLTCVGYAETDAEITV